MHLTENRCYQPYQVRVIVGGCVQHHDEGCCDRSSSEKRRNQWRLSHWQWLPELVQRRVSCSKFTWIERWRERSVGIVGLGACKVYIADRWLKICTLLRCTQQLLTNCPNLRPGFSALININEKLLTAINCVFAGSLWACSSAKLRRSLPDSTWHVHANAMYLSQKMWCDQSFLVANGW